MTPIKLACHVSTLFLWGLCVDYKLYSSWIKKIKKPNSHFIPDRSEHSYVWARLEGMFRTLVLGVGIRSPGGMWQCLEVHFDCHHRGRLLASSAWSLWDATGRAPQCGEGLHTCANTGNPLACRDPALARCAALHVLKGHWKSEGQVRGSLVHVGQMTDW